MPEYVPPEYVPLKPVIRGIPWLRHKSTQFANVSGPGPRGIRRGLLYLSTRLLYDP